MGNSRRLNKYEKEVGGVTLVLRQGWASACHRKPVNKFGQEISGKQDIVPSPFLAGSDFWRLFLSSTYIHTTYYSTTYLPYSMENWVSLSLSRALQLWKKQHENL
eukprot:scaffold4090_cov84-Skeletonema_marinoi.AAC.7